MITTRDFNETRGTLRCGQPAYYYNRKTQHRVLLAFAYDNVKDIVEAIYSARAVILIGLERNDDEFVMGVPDVDSAIEQLKSYCAVL